MAITLSPADLSAPDFAALVAAHAAFAAQTAPPESNHYLTVDKLAEPGVMIFAAHQHGVLVGMGGLKRLSDSDGEVKSMHTAAAARGRGVAGQILAAVLSEARAAGLTTLWLETGTHPLFAPARALYAKAGFVECPPFADYVLDPHSVFMTRRIDEEALT